MFAFYWPYWIVLLPLPWIIEYYLNHKKVTAKEKPGIKIKFPRIDKLKATIDYSTAKHGNGIVIKVLSYLLWVLLVLSLMRPEIVQDPQYTKQYGYDLMLAVDLSRSMSALDMTQGGSNVTRLQVVKEVVDKFVQQRRGDRLGLLVFGAAAYPYVPLTYDIDTVSKQLQLLTVGMAGDSTAIGDVIALAVKNLQHRKGQRILILLTDGEDNASVITPKQALKLAIKYHIKIHTIGVGSSGTVPLRDKDGNIVMYNLVLDEKLLHEIADTTGGIYARATSKHGLEKIYQQIDMLEKHEEASHTVIIRSSLHYYLLGAVLLILLALLIMYRRNSNALE